MTHQEGKSSLFCGSYVITLQVEIDKLIEKDYDQKKTTISRPKQKSQMNNLIKLRLNTLTLKILILKLKQIRSKTVIRKAKVQHHQKNLLRPIWILNQQ